MITTVQREGQTRSPASSLILKHAVLFKTVSPPRSMSFCPCRFTEPEGRRQMLRETGAYRRHGSRRLILHPGLRKRGPGGVQLRRKRANIDLLWKIWGQIRHSLLKKQWLMPQRGLAAVGFIRTRGSEKHCNDQEFGRQTHWWGFSIQSYHDVMNQHPPWTNNWAVKEMYYKHLLCI